MLDLFQITTRFLLMIDSRIRYTPIALVMENVGANGYSLRPLAPINKIGFHFCMLAMRRTIFWSYGQDSFGKAIKRHLMQVLLYMREIW